MTDTDGIFHPKDFGAVGDGVTDDSAAFQAWVNASVAWAKAHPPEPTDSPPPGDYERARSMLPWQPGAALPEERIRRLRDSGAGDDLLAEQPAHYPPADEEASS